MPSGFSDELWKIAAAPPSLQSMEAYKAKKELESIKASGRSSAYPKAVALGAAGGAALPFVTSVLPGWMAEAGEGKPLHRLRLVETLKSVYPEVPEKELKPLAAAIQQSFYQTQHLVDPNMDAVVNRLRSTIGPVPHGVSPEQWAEVVGAGGPGSAEQLSSLKRMLWPASREEYGSWLTTGMRKLEERGASQGFGREAIENLKALPAHTKAALPMLALFAALGIAGSVSATHSKRKKLAALEKNSEDTKTTRVMKALPGIAAIGGGAWGAIDPKAFNPESLMPRLVPHARSVRGRIVSGVLGAGLTGTAAALPLMLRDTKRAIFKRKSPERA